MESVLQTTRERCFLCGRQGVTEEHHVLHGHSNRKNAEKYGLKVYLCPMCHRNLHDRGECDLYLIQYAQKYFEANLGDRDAFRRIFGKSWL